MNALTASIAVCLISAIASTIVALITARSRIGVLAAKPLRASSSPPDIYIELTESEAKFRVFGWLVVVSLYLAAIFCLSQGLNAVRISHHWDQWQLLLGACLRSGRKSTSMQSSG